MVSRVSSDDLWVKNLDGDRGYVMSAYYLMSAAYYLMSDHASRINDAWVIGCLWLVKGAGTRWYFAHTRDLSVDPDTLYLVQKGGHELPPKCPTLPPGTLGLSLRGKVFGSIPSDVTFAVPEGWSRPENWV